MVSKNRKEAEAVVCLFQSSTTKKAEPGRPRPPIAEINDVRIDWDAYFIPERVAAPLRDLGKRRYQVRIEYQDAHGNAVVRVIRDISALTRCVFRNPPFDGDMSADIAVGSGDYWLAPLFFRPPDGFSYTTSYMYVVPSFTSEPLDVDVPAKEVRNIVKCVAFVEPVPETKQSP